MRVCQVLPDAKEERPAYFAGLGKIEFSNHRGSEQAPCPVADMHALAVEQCAGGIAMQGHSLPSPKTSDESLGKFVSEQNIAHYRKCLAERADEKQRQVLLKLLAGELAKK